MIDHIVGNNPLPANIRKDIIERTDGIPLFVEEMTKAVLEAESEAEARRTAACGSLPGAGGPRKPARVVDGAARPTGPSQGAGADRGGDRTRILSCAAGGGGVQAGGGSWERSSTASFGRACCSGRASPPNATYLFKHALVQDAAYGLLLREPRRELHTQIAEALESKFDEIAENKPELLARHCAEAGHIEKAAGLWGKAGQRSAQRSALVEADGTAQARARPDRDLAKHARAASRRDQASSGAHYPAPPCQGLRGAGNQGCRRAGASADGTSQDARRASRRSAVVVLRSLRLLGREPCVVQRRRDA